MRFDKNIFLLKNKNFLTIRNLNTGKAEKSYRNDVTKKSPIVTN